MTENDLRILKQFAAELRLIEKLVKEGHSRRCAQHRVFSDRLHCGCLEARDAERELARKRP